MLGKVKKGQIAFILLESWLKTLIWGGKYQIWLLFTQIMIPCLYAGTNEDANTYAWPRDYWISICPKDSRADQKSWHSISKRLLETKLLSQSFCAMKFGKVLQVEYIVLLIYCHNFLSKQHGKEAFDIKAKKKPKKTPKNPSFNDWQNVAVLYPSFSPHQPLPHVWLVALRTPLPSHQILPLHFFNICSLLFWSSSSVPLRVPDLLLNLWLTQQQFLQGHDLLLWSVL